MTPLNHALVRREKAWKIFIMLYIHGKRRNAHKLYTEFTCSTCNVRSYHTYGATQIFQAFSLHMVQRSWEEGESFGSRLHCLALNSCPASSRVVSLPHYLQVQSEVSKPYRESHNNYNTRCIIYLIMI
jgi:hypothetical protein